MHINPMKAGVALGALLGLWHLVWSVLVLLGWGQGLLAFILRVHMIHLSLTVGPFDFGTAVSLIIVTAIVGYIAGYAFAMIWNRVHKR
jgi:hypothetical protein